jgi:DNA-binding MarR family transcriptional regulator
LLRRPIGGTAYHTTLRSVPRTRRLAQHAVSILSKLKRVGPSTINALASSMVMDRSTLGRNILPLDRKGLITSEASESDRRSKVLRLTAVGEQRLQAALGIWICAP